MHAMLPKMSDKEYLYRTHSFGHWQYMDKVVPIFMNYHIPFTYYWMIKYRLE